MIILSANPPYAGWLVDGVKKVEWWRRRLPDGLALIYETKSGGGSGKVIGEAVICGFDRVCPDEASERLISAGRAPREYLMKYSCGEPLYANHVENGRRYEDPKSLEEFGLSRPPQSWRHVR